MPDPSQLFIPPPAQKQSDQSLQDELIKRAQADIQRKLMPPAAGDALPGTMRAADAMRKDYPADMVGVRVVDMPWDSPEAFSNILGATPTKLPEELLKLLPSWRGAQGDPESIEVNPGSSIMEPQGALNSVLAHELQHVRQNRNGDPIQRLKERQIDYSERPSELEAQLAARRYEEAHQNPTSVRDSQENPQGMYTVLHQLQRLGPH